MTQIATTELWESCVVWLWFLERKNIRFHCTRNLVMARNLVLTPEESVRPELVRTAPIVQVVTGIMRGIPKWPQVCKLSES